MITLKPNKFGGVWTDEELGLEVLKIKGEYALVHVELDCIYTVIKGDFKTIYDCIDYSNNLITKSYQRAFCY